PRTILAMIRVELFMLGGRCTLSVEASVGRTVMRLSAHPLSPLCSFFDLQSTVCLKMGASQQISLPVHSELRYPSACRNGTASVQARTVSYVPWGPLTD